jgi:hypothetical protein
MYEEEVEREFSLLMAAAKTERQLLRRAVEVQVRKELGIYDLSIKLAKMKLATSEVERQLRGYTQKQGSYHNEPSVLDLAIERRLSEVDGAVDRVKAVQDSVIRSIRLCGMPAEVQTIFKALPEQIGKVEKALVAAQKQNARLRAIAKEKATALVLGEVKVDDE